ncbi:MAG: ribonuclease R [Alphaproteobacteria bacterium]|nr:ribonuclease R [Alphaproteobacteria bacterium]
MKTSSRHRHIQPGKKKTVKPKHKLEQTSAHRAREESTHLVGVVARGYKGWILQPTNRRERGDYALHVPNDFDAAEGTIALAKKIPGRRWHSREARLVETLGDINSPRAVSLIAIATHGIPDEFSADALAEARSEKPFTLKDRADLRAVPLVTIDGEDSRDFDDAVFAEPDGKGWHLIVAIADVAHYVTPGGALDKAAYARGNSTYFPDRVVPMLPEILSDDLCSLKPHVERPCVAAHLWIDKAGELTHWEFVRGVMKSHARLTYEQVQRAKDGQADTTTQPLMNAVIEPLYGAYRCLLSARLKRGTLELDLPERKVEIENGQVKSIRIRDRLDSHRLIEEFMITANVAAAAQLEGKACACLYRIHDRPTEMKLDSLRDFLNSIGISLAPKKKLHARFLTQVLENEAGTPHAQVVNEMMLRAQSQAVYSPENIGHFGLALAKYAHFTSPIRRYADLIVHRGLIRACGLGEDGLTEREIAKLDAIADHVSTTERRSVAAERDAVDRFITLFLADRVGFEFTGRISGVARFGLFARLDETGADGLIPFDALPHDHYYYDEKRQALVGRHGKRFYQLMKRVVVRLEKADRLTGSMSMSIVEKKNTPDLTSVRRQKAQETKGKPKS